MTLRLRPDVYEAVRRSASGNFRSITAEINELLVEVINTKEKASDVALGKQSDASITNE